MQGQGRTLQPLEDAVDGAGAAAARHGDVELVGVVGHREGRSSWS